MKRDLTLTRGWYTARELAGLPGMPKSISGVIRKARVEDWSAQTHQGRGNGREYALASLPVVTRVALMEKVSRREIIASAQTLNELANRHYLLAEKLRELVNAFPKDEVTGGRA